MDAKVAQNKGGHDHRCEEANVEGVYTVVNVGSVFLEECICNAPAKNGQDAVNVGGEVIIGEVDIVDILVFADEA
jgi:hypothetical protein